MGKARKSQKWNETELNEVNNYESLSTYTETKPCYEVINSYKINFKAKNEKQKLLYNLIHDKEIVFVQGAAGSGKSFVGLSAALDLLKSDNPYKQIVLIAQTVQSELELGFLKGGIDDKILPFLAPTFYNIEKILKESNNKRSSKDILSDLRKCEFIVYNHISFLRGVNIDNSIVVIDEAQQYSKSAMKTILTRIGKNSKYIFMSDVEQCDNKELKKNKEMIGIRYAMDKLKDIENVGIVEFGNEDVIRNPIISKILDVWE